MFCYGQKLIQEVATLKLNPKIATLNDLLNTFIQRIFIFDLGINIIYIFLFLFLFYLFYFYFYFFQIVQISSYVPINMTRIPHKFLYFDLLSGNLRNYKNRFFLPFDFACFNIVLCSMTICTIHSCFL
jgi:hypothetical protein